MASTRVIRFSGSFSRSFCTRSLASSLTHCQNSSSISYRPSMVLRSISSGNSESNGRKPKDGIRTQMTYVPESMKYMMTPIAKLSALKPIFLNYNVSGAK